MGGGGGGSGRINSTRVRVEHVANDDWWIWYLLYVVSVWVVVLSQPSSRDHASPHWEINLCLKKI